MPVAASPRRLINTFHADIRVGDSCASVAAHISTGSQDKHTRQRCKPRVTVHRHRVTTLYTRAAKAVTLPSLATRCYQESSQRRQSTHKKAIQSSFNLSRQGESSIYVKIPSGRRLRGPESRTHSWREKKQNCQVFPAPRSSSLIPAVYARSSRVRGRGASPTPFPRA